MKKILIVFLLVLACVLTWGAKEGIVSPEGSYWVTGPYVWNADERKFRAASFLVSEGRITRVLWDGVPDALSPAIHAYPGRFIIPGLINAHVHSSNSSACKPGEAFRPWTGRHNLMTWLADGFTTVADMGGWPAFVAELKEWAARHPNRAPRLMMAGPILTVKEGYPSNWLPDSARMVDAVKFIDGSDWEKLLGDLDGFGADYAKLGLQEHSFGGQELPFPEQSQIEGLVFALHARGKKLFVHSLSAQSYEMGLSAQADAFIHAPHESLSDDTIAKIARAGTPVIPTIWIWKSNWWVPEGHEDVLRTFRESARVQQSWKKYLSDYRAGDVIPEYLVHEAGVTKQSLKDAHIALLDNLARMRAAGVTFVYGTDAPMCFNAPGAGFEEMRELHEAGFTAAEILEMATTNAAHLLGISSETGSIADGREASFIVLASDPTADLNALRRPEAVYHRGLHVPLEPDLSLRDFIASSVSFLKALIITLFP